MTTPAPVPSPRPPELDGEDTGQFPVVHADLKAVKRSLSWQNAVQVLVLLGAAWAVWTFGIAAVVAPAVAESPKVQQLDQRLTTQEKKTERLEDLAIRQLTEQRAIGEWIALGKRSAILDEPLPVKTKDAGP